MTRKREVALRLLRGEPVELLSRQLGVEIFRLELWREKAIAGIDASLKERKRSGEGIIAMKRIGELIMQVELLEAKTETSGPLAAEVAAMSAVYLSRSTTVWPTASSGSVGLGWFLVLRHEIPAAGHR